uniref:Malectin-like domain-containing protein n=1 Tax=Rhizophora mucronata TaxID=61149 RepID=A0A2P2QKE5_RHIMU
MHHEMIYETKGDGATVCLVNIGDGIPFISSLEATSMMTDFYGLMENKTALFLHIRID